MLIDCRGLASGWWGLPNLLGAVLALSIAGVAAASPEPRNKLGQPDLEGVWSYNSITTLERPSELKAIKLTDAEARAYEAAHPGTPEPARGGPVGQDATEWWEMGGKLGRLDGKARSSWIVEPRDGKLPYSDAGPSSQAQRDGLSVFLGRSGGQLVRAQLVVARDILLLSISRCAGDVETRKQFDVAEFRSGAPPFGGR